MTNRQTYRIRLLGVALFIAGTVQAQVHNASNVHVGSGVEIHIDGTVSNSGFVQNQGELLVTGDWLNTNVYQGLGRITLLGSTLQRVKNNTNNIYALRIVSNGPVE